MPAPDWSRKASDGRNSRSLISATPLQADKPTSRAARLRYGRVRLVRAYKADVVAVAKHL